MNEWKLPVGISRRELLFYCLLFYCLLFSGGMGGGVGGKIFCSSRTLQACVQSGIPGFQTRLSRERFPSAAIVIIVVSLKGPWVCPSITA